MLVNLRREIFNIGRQYRDIDMSHFDEDPLDLFEDDGDGVNEMCILFDPEDKGSSNNQNNVVDIGSYKLFTRV